MNKMILKLKVDPKGVVLKAMNDGKKYIAIRRRVTKHDAKIYYRSLVPQKRYKDMDGKVKTRSTKLGTYCENCGRLIGENYQVRKSVMYKVYYVCPECKEDLIREVKTGEQVSALNLNDVWEAYGGKL